MGKKGAKKKATKFAITFFVLLILVIILITAFMLTSYITPESLGLINIKDNNYDVGTRLNTIYITHWEGDSEFGYGVRVNIREPNGITLHGPYQANAQWPSCQEPQWWINYWSSTPKGIPITLGSGIMLFAEGEWRVEYELYRYRGDCDGNVYPDSPWAYLWDSGIETFTVGTITHQLLIGSSPIGCTITVQSEEHPPDFIKTVVSHDGMDVFVVEEGIYTVTVSHEGYTTKMDEVAVLSDTNIMFSLDEIPVEEPEPEPEPEPEVYAVTVKVFDDATNLPIIGAKVTADNTDKFTDSNGEAIYSLEGGGKTYSVSVIASGYNSGLKTTTVYLSPETVSFHLTLCGNGEEPEPEPAKGIPGFEILTLIIAIGVCLIFFYYKKRRKQ